MQRRLVILDKAVTLTLPKTARRSVQFLAEERLATIGGWG